MHVGSREEGSLSLKKQETIQNGVKECAVPRLQESSSLVDATARD